MPFQWNTRNPMFLWISSHCLTRDSLKLPNHIPLDWSSPPQAFFYLGASLQEKSPLLEVKLNELLYSYSLPRLWFHWCQQDIIFPTSLCPKPKQRQVEKRPESISAAWIKKLLINKLAWIGTQGKFLVPLILLLLWMYILSTGNITKSLPQTVPALDQG